MQIKKLAQGELHFRSPSPASKAHELYNTVDIIRLFYLRVNH